MGVFRGEILSEKKRWYEGNFWKKHLYAELNKRAEAAVSSYSATGDFLQYIYSVLVAKNHQEVQFRCLVHEFFFGDVF